MTSLDASGTRYLELLGGLLTVARPGALFPNAARLRAWLALFSRPTPKGLLVKLEVHQLGGFPVRRALVRFHRLQAVARSVLEGVRPSAKARAFSAALINVELPPLSRVEARLVGKARGVERFTVSYDTLDARTGCPTRYTAQVEQRKVRHLVLERGDQARASAAFERELAVSCEGRVENALVALQSIEGLTVPEVVRAQLGPFVCALCPAGPGRDLEALRGVVTGGEAVLSLLLDRAGPGVSVSRCADPWRALDATPEMVRRRVAVGYRVSLERRLVCTPGMEERLRVVAPGVIVRSH